MQRCFEQYLAVQHNNGLRFSQQRCGGVVAIEVCSKQVISLVPGLIRGLHRCEGLVQAEVVQATPLKEHIRRELRAAERFQAHSP